MDGFEIPLHRSLTEPILLGGAPRSAAILIRARAWAAPLDTWPVGLDRRPCGRGDGGESRPGFHGRRHAQPPS